MHDRLQEQIADLARTDRRYPADAYMLVFDGLEHALANMGTRRHVTPRELVLGVRDAAVDNWGLLARSVLETWGMRDTGAIGDLVFNLIRRGLLEAGEEDTRDQFDDAFSFEEGLDGHFKQSIERDPPRLVARGA